MSKKYDYLLLISIIILSVFGILMIYSSSMVLSLYKFNDSYHYVKMQIAFLLLSIIVLFILKNIDYHIYYKYANIILLISFILLILVLIPGIGQIRNGSRSWFGIGPFGIQPSEFSKISLVIFVSKYLSNNKSIMNKIIKGVFPILLIIFMFFITILLEPDFGTGMVIVISLITLIFVSGVPINFFIKSFILGIIGIVGIIISAPYRLKRIISFINPWSDPLGSGYQILQSLYAIGPSGLIGRGLFNSRQKYFYLPEPQTDFIFSIISEELGFLGILIVSSLFIFIIYRIIRISIKQSDLFGKYLSFGLGIIILIQVLINLSVVTGLIPVTGVTLPFLSYGGSSLLVSFASIGIILNISKNSG